MDDGFDPSQHVVTGATLVVSLLDDGDEDFTHEHIRHSEICIPEGIPGVPAHCIPLEETIIDGPHFEYALMSTMEGLIGASFEVDNGDYQFNFFNAGGFADGMIDVRLSGTGFPSAGTSDNDWVFASSTLYVEFDALHSSPDPVPEPTTCLLLGIGIAGLAGADVRRRRKKKAID